MRVGILSIDGTAKSHEGESKIIILNLQITRPENIGVSAVPTFRVNGANRYIACQRMNLSEQALINNTR